MTPSIGPPVDEGQEVDSEAEGTLHGPIRHRGEGGNYLYPVYSAEWKVWRKLKRRRPSGSDAIEPPRPQANDHLR